MGQLIACQFEGDCPSVPCLNFYNITSHINGLCPSAPPGLQNKGNVKNWCKQQSACNHINVFHPSPSAPRKGTRSVRVMPTPSQWCTAAEEESSLNAPVECGATLRSESRAQTKESETDFLRCRICSIQLSWGFY